jgi:hypothetical protein
MHEADRDQRRQPQQPMQRKAQVAADKRCYGTNIKDGASWVTRA